MLPPFELFCPTELAEACLLKKKGAKVIAGGTDVLVALNNGSLLSDTLIDIKNIPEMAGISYSENAGLVIGALATHRELELCKLIKDKYHALFCGCSQVGSVQIRCRGTIGGNICNAVPSADSVGPLLSFDAHCDIIGHNGCRSVPLAEFFLGPKHTVLQPDELLLKIRLPTVPEGSGSYYTKYTRRNAMDLALLGISVYVELCNDMIKNARIALSTAAPTPMRARKTENYLIGKYVRDVDTVLLGRIAAMEASPRTSWRSSREYRLALINNLLGRTFEKSVLQARGNGQ